MKFKTSLTDAELRERVDHWVGFFFLWTGFILASASAAIIWGWPGFGLVTGLFFIICAATDR